MTLNKEVLSALNTNQLSGFWVEHRILAAFSTYPASMSTWTFNNSKYLMCSLKHLDSLLVTK